VVAADGAVIDDDIPCPERDGVPLLDLEALVGLAGGGGGGRAGRGGSLAGGGGRRRRVDVGLHGGHRARSREPSIRFDSGQRKDTEMHTMIFLSINNCMHCSVNVKK